MTRSEAEKIVMDDVRGRMAACNVHGCGRCHELRDALAILSTPEQRPEGVPEFVYIGRGYSHMYEEHQINESWRETPFYGPMDPDEWLRFKFDGIVETGERGE